MTDCPTCDTARVSAPGPHSIDPYATTDALIERVESGRMLELRGDVPLVDMMALAESDLKYTIVSYLECRRCRRILFWGLCIRGAPIFQHVDAAAVDAWEGDPVPPRDAWACR
ncbi:hypothetical protein [Jiangella alba]|uniref:Uncharacterized protein n=1 Tax=Jiangella alba TaxID=561176 RepID=A0A1H5MIU4_9ACTN|nr:hypothetical protein [Jiangella alba]SEE89299.1 hypothetical protein SAMN04488561_3212 [Jiangella alba]